MDDQIADRTTSHMFPADGIDKTVGFLGIGLIVIGFFFLTVIGMGRMHKVATDTAAQSSFDASPATGEISGAPVVEPPR